MPCRSTPPKSLNTGDTEGTAETAARGTPFLKLLPAHPEPATVSYNITLVAPDGTENTISARGDEHMWDAALRAGIRLPALCHQGWCLTCAALRTEGGCVEQRDSVAFYSQDDAAGFTLLCTGKACSDLRLRTHQARAMRQHRLRLRLPAPYANL